MRIVWSGADDSQYRTPEIERWRALGRDLDERAERSSGDTRRAQQLGARLARGNALRLIFEAAGVVTR